MSRPTLAARQLHRPPLGYDDAAAYISVSRRHLEDLVREGCIAHLRIGRCVRFDPVDLDAFLDRHRVEESA